MDQRAYGVEVPCCTDRLSLMAGTYGNVDLSLVPSEKARYFISVRCWFSLPLVEPSSESERLEV